MGFDLDSVAFAFLAVKKQGNMGTITDKLAVRRMIDRTWRAHLSANELAVVQFIFSVVNDWGKDYDRIKYEHFLNGIGAQCGLGMSQSTLQRALKSLLNRGSIERFRSRTGYSFRLVLTWNPTAIGMLKTPKRLQKTAIMTGQIDQSCVVNLTSPYRKEHTRKEHTYSSGPSATAAVMVPTHSKMETVEAAIDAARMRNKAAKNRKGKHVNAETIWVSAFRECYPDAAIPVTGPKDRGQLNHFTRSMNLDRMQFVDWVVREWRLIISTRFRWMEKSEPPEYPSIGFALSFKEKFYDAWNDKDRLQTELKLTARDRQRTRLVRQGYSQEQADVEVERSRNIAAERGQLAKDRALLNSILNKAERSREQARARAPTVEHNGLSGVRSSSSDGLSKVDDAVRNLRGSDGGSTVRPRLARPSDLRDGDDTGLPELPEANDDGI